MKLSILVPFRDADQTRTPAKNWILRRWAHFYPEAEIIEAPDDGIDPFNKSMAVNKAASLATGDVYAILDADTWIDPQHMERGLSLIERGVVPWVVPARRSLRLRKDVSQRIMALDPRGDLPAIRAIDAEQSGPVVGFLWLVNRKGFDAIGGMDERIRGWGGEDTMFTWAMDRVVGPHRKLSGTVMSLWHARPRDSKRHRIWVGQDRSLERCQGAARQALRQGIHQGGHAAGTPLRAGRDAAPRCTPPLRIGTPGHDASPGELAGHQGRATKAGSPVSHGKRQAPQFLPWQKRTARASCAVTGTAASGGWKAAPTTPTRWTTSSPGCGMVRCSDEANAVASCRSCNLRRNHLKPGERGAYGSTPDAPRRFGGVPRSRPFLSREGEARGAVGKIHPRSRWATMSADYTRRPSEDDAD